MPYLELQTRTEGVKQIRLGEDHGSKLTIGRHASNQVPIVDDELISRFHCEIECTDEGYVLKDLDSRNGTAMDGMRIVRVVLQPGSEFFVGRTRCSFVADSAPTPVASLDATPQADTAEDEGRSDPTAGTATGASPVDEAAAGDLTLSLDTSYLYVGEDEGRPAFDTSQYRIGSIDALATVGHDVPFDVTSLALINARGQTVHAAEEDDSSAAITLRILRLLLLGVLGCIRCGASDIHLEPKRHSSLARLRIDGAMVEVCELDPESAKRLSSLTKVLCDIDMTKKAIVQEGHFSTKAPGRRVDYRISFTPSMFGQKLVVRVLDPENAPQTLRDLELPDWMLHKIRDTVKQDTGMLLVTGPTGSGKTTTLYAGLRQVDASLRNVITIEDPVEYEVPGVTQIPVDEEHGASFHSLLRSCLRQDPDVIVLGEIRDRDTATTAMQAATTGHLVLSTIHAKDTIGTVFRLLDLGCEPYLVASTLNLVLAQRLVRRLCPQCKKAKKATPEQIRQMGKTVEGVAHLHAPSGCPQCFGTGYTGRRGLFELLAATDELRDVILNNPNIADIKKIIELSVFTSLRDAGFGLVTEGVTSMDEIARVIGLE